MFPLGGRFLETLGARERKVVHLQIQAYESSTVDRKEMIHRAGFVDPGQLTFSWGLLLARAGTTKLEKVLDDILGHLLVSEAVNYHSWPREEYDYGQEN